MSGPQPSWRSRVACGPCAVRSPVRESVRPRPLAQPPQKTEEPSRCGTSHPEASCGCSCRIEATTLGSPYTPDCHRTDQLTPQSHHPGRLQSVMAKRVWVGELSHESLPTGALRSWPKHVWQLRSGGNPEAAAPRPLSLFSDAATQCYALHWLHDLKTGSSKSSTPMAHYVPLKLVSWW